MHTQKLAGARSARRGVGYTVIGLAFLVSLVGSESIATAQSVSPHPVARLIGETTNDSRPRRVNAPAETAHAANGNPNSSPSVEEATETERRAFEKTNEMRAKNGLAPLVWDHDLCLMARSHSRDMSVLGFFSHQTPEGLRLRDRARAAGVRYRVIAENIAYNQGYDDPGAFAVERWTISSAHRANLLSAEFIGSAVGSFVASDGTVYFTQIFILR